MEMETDITRYTAIYNKNFECLYRTWMCFIIIQTSIGLSITRFETTIFEDDRVVVLRLTISSLLLHFMFFQLGKDKGAHDVMRFSLLAFYFLMLYQVLKNVYETTVNLRE